MGLRQWVYGLWKYYRRYTHSAIHAAAAAALTIFGLLVFVDPLFAGVAIAAYVCPPIVLYVLGIEVAPEDQPTESTETRSDEATTQGATFETYPMGDGDTDSDSDDGDTDSDTDGGDTDSDRDGGDTDSDRDGGDTDSDSNNGDTDSDSDN